MATILKRVGKKGRVTYLAQIRMRGFPPMNRSFTTKSDARDWAGRTERELRSGAMVVLADRTVEELLDEYQRASFPLGRAWTMGG